MPSSLDGLLTQKLGCASVSNLADPGASSTHYEEMLYFSMLLSKPGGFSGLQLSPSLVSLKTFRPSGSCVLWCPT